MGCLDVVAGIQSFHMHIDHVHALCLCAKQQALFESNYVVAIWFQEVDSDQHGVQACFIKAAFWG